MKGIHMKNVVIIPLLLMLVSFSQCKFKKNNPGGGGGDVSIPDIPSAQDVQDHLDDMTNGPTKGSNDGTVDGSMDSPIKCRDGSIIDRPKDVEPKDSLYPFGSPIQGALKVFASKYQTCRILDNVPGTISYDGPLGVGLLNKWKMATPKLYPAEGPSCRDATTFPSKKGCRVAGKCKLGFGEVLANPLEYNQSLRSVKVSNNELKVLESASDCSSFVSTAFRAVGLKMSPSDSASSFLDTTSGINSKLRNGSSCFEEPVVAIDEIVKPGDVLNTAGEHVVMVDKVFNDPFGIEALLEKVKTREISQEKALNSCKTLNKANFKMILIHSTGKDAGHGDGIRREHASRFYSGSATSVLESTARRSCLHFISQYPNSQSGFKLGTNMPSTGKSHLRHKGKKDPKCIYQTKPKIEGEECINECLQNGYAI